MFNHEKLLTLEAEVERLKVSEAAAHVLRESVSGLYERMVADKDNLIAQLQEELAQAKGKISLMETIMMPLSSKAGALYQDSLTPQKKQNFKTVVEPAVSEWQRHKRAVEADLEKAYAAEDKKEK